MQQAGQTWPTKIYRPMANRKSYTFTRPYEAYVEEAPRPDVSNIHFHTGLCTLQ